MRPGLPALLGLPGLQNPAKGKDRNSKGANPPQAIQPFRIENPSLLGGRPYRSKEDETGAQVHRLFHFLGLMNRQAKTSLGRLLPELFPGEGFPTPDESVGPADPGPIRPAVHGKESCLGGKSSKAGQSFPIAASGIPEGPGVG